MSGIGTPVLVPAPNPGLMTLDGTNTWVVLGRDGVIVVDPGPNDAAHFNQILEHGPVSAVLLSHRHEDHSAALAHLAEGTPVYAVAPQFAQHVAPLSDGMSVNVDGLTFTTHLTPGHSDDSVCFSLMNVHEPILFTGDTLLGGRHASYISRAGGRLDDYLASLERLTAFTGYRGLPGHGPVIHEVGQHARNALAYRTERLDQLRLLIKTSGEPSPENLVKRRYPDRPEKWAAAARMIVAEIGFLQDEQARRDRRQSL